MQFLSVRACRDSGEPLGTSCNVTSTSCRGRLHKQVGLPASYLKNEMRNVRQSDSYSVSSRTPNHPREKYVGHLEESVHTPIARLMQQRSTTIVGRDRVFHEMMSGGLNADGLPLSNPDDAPPLKQHRP